MKLPNQVPESGFYYHYKHDPNGPVENYAYDVMAVGTQTETHEQFVLYRTLYQIGDRGGARYWARPLGMFNEDIIRDGNVIKRFQKITDEQTIVKLEKIRGEMYK